MIQYTEALAVLASELVVGDVIDYHDTYWLVDATSRDGYFGVHWNVETHRVDVELSCEKHELVVVSDELFLFTFDDTETVSIMRVSSDTIEDMIAGLQGIVANLNGQ